MIRNLLILVSVIALLASCTGSKPLSQANHKPVPAVSASNSKSGIVKTEPKKNDIKFLDEISANPQLTAGIPDAKTEQKITVPVTVENRIPGNSATTENLSDLQLKYSALLGTDPGLIENTELLRSVDEWYGTKYRMGGTTKSGIDCSAFVQVVYLTAFGLSVPRTAFEQFRGSNRISATQMREGDLVFFNTTGGVSHVGIYLRNNKFIHASVARGVTVSDLFDPYYLKRFLGVGRIEKAVGTN